MKIGIVSFYDTQQNYGQVLQCYAMQRFFAALGHDVFHLRYDDRPTASRLSKIGKLWDICSHGLFRAYIENRRAFAKPGKELGFIRSKSNLNKRGFDSFRERHIALTEETYTIDRLKRTPPAVDAWVTGSDQVWGLGASELFQLQFGPRKAKKIAYAASMGGFRLTNGYQRHFFGKYLRGFDYISLREQDGVDECRALGFSKARLVPDPTLLIEAEQYRAISEKPAIAEGKKYVLLYLLGNPIDVEVDEIAAWARSKQYELIYTASQGREDEFAKYDATPQEWLGLIDHAEAVITNSFHGMVFSILFNKPFLVIPISGAWSRMNSRLTTTLDELHIDRTHIYAGDPNRVNAPIDYAAANRIIEEKRAQIRTELEAVLHR